MDLVEIFSDNLKYYRHKAHLKVKELSELASVSISVIYKMERGWDSINLSTLDKIAAALNVPPYVLFENRYLGA